MTAESSVIEFAEEPAMTCIWRAAPKPCISPYVPWYLGAKRAPKGYQWLPVTVSQDTHFAPGEEELHIDVSKAFWAFRVLQYFTEFDYKGTHEAIRKSADELEAAWDAEQPAFREKCRSLLKEAPELAEELLSAYTEAPGTEGLGLGLEDGRAAGRGAHSQEQLHPVPASGKCLSFPQIEEQRTVPDLRADRIKSEKPVCPLGYTGFFE